MIAGTFILEDLAVHFKLPDTSDGMVKVYVQEGLHGECAKVECTPREFAASICMALDFDGMAGALEESLQEYAKGIQVPSHKLRWWP